MKRLLINGSPRGKNSGSRKILSWIQEGFAEEKDIQIIDLAKVRELQSQKESFLDAEEVVMIMPLYTDSMPGIVKNFIDSLQNEDLEKLKGKKLAFIVHSGFPESIHSETLAAYFKRLSERVGFVYAGTVIKGGTEGILNMPEERTAKVAELFREVGRNLKSDWKIPQEIIRKSASPRVFNLPVRILITLLRWTGFIDTHWNTILMKNNAFDKRFDAPYGTPFGKKK